MRWETHKGLTICWICSQIVALDSRSPRGSFAGAPCARCRSRSLHGREADRDAARHGSVFRDMRFVLVGPAARRQRLRANLPEGIDVAGEAPTMGAARALALDRRVLVAGHNPDGRRRSS